MARQNKKVSTLINFGKMYYNQIFKNQKYFPLTKRHTDKVYYNMIVWQNMKLLLFHSIFVLKMYTWLCVCVTSNP